MGNPIIQTISETSFKHAHSVDLSKYLVVGNLKWTAILNDDPATKDDYPYGYTITGRVTENTDPSYGELQGLGCQVGDTWGTGYEYYLHTDGSKYICRNSPTTIEYEFTKK